MIQYTVSKAAVKKATARLGLSKTQAQNVLPKYAQGASFVWSLDSTSVTSPFMIILVNRCAWLSRKMGRF
nr:hypothetical protein [Bacillus licheniformis]